MNRIRTYDQTYLQIHGQPPPQKVTFAESDADIISVGRGFMGGFDHTMQSQVGCPGGCLFCYVKTGARLAPKEVRENWGFDVRSKRNVEQKLRKHLTQGTLADKIIYSSGVTDPYAEKGFVTRSIWQIWCDTPLHLRPRRIVVQTRFRPDRDVQLIAKYCQLTTASDSGPPVVVSYSIGTDRNDLIRAWDRATPTFEQRMRAIENLRQAGIFVVPTLSPFALWNDLVATLEQFKAWGIPYITVLFFKETTKSANTPKRFLAYLRKEYPMLLNPIWQTEQVEKIEAIFGVGHVVVGQDGFTSLANPHQIVEINEKSERQAPENPRCEPH